MKRLTIADKIRAFRASEGITQTEFGERLGVSAQAVSKWETEKGYPDITLLPALAKLLGCSVDAFFSES